MLQVRKTSAGWIVTADGMDRDGMLISGAICGRVTSYNRDRLANVGLDYDADPHGNDLSEIATNVDMLVECCTPDRVLNRGERVS